MTKLRPNYDRTTLELRSNYDQTTTKLRPNYDQTTTELRLNYNPTKPELGSAGEVSVLSGACRMDRSGDRGSRPLEKQKGGVVSADGLLDFQAGPVRGRGRCR